MLDDLRIPSESSNSMNTIVNQFMVLAMQEARIAMRRGEVPVGAVIANAANGVIIGSASNAVRRMKDPTAHAEMLAIRAASKSFGYERLINCDIYVTLEPCPMCAHAITLARFRRLYFAAYDPNGGAVEHGPRLFQQTSCNHRPDVYGGYAEREAAELLRSFFRARR